jgi:hypothetical protein
MALMQFVAPDGTRLVPNGGLGFLLASGATLAAGATLALLVAKLVSDWGIGNGFCIIILLQNFWPDFARVHNVLRVTGPVGEKLEPIVWLAAIGLLRMFALRPHAAFRDSRQEPIPVLTRPLFPQGILPVLWAYAALNFLTTLMPVLGVLGVPSGIEHSPIALVVITVLIAAFSLGAFHLFSGRRRLKRNLPPGVLPAEGGAIRQSLLQSTALLVVFGVAFPAGAWFLNFRLPAFLFPTLVVAVAVGLDLVIEWRFRHRYGDRVACIIEMDNVYCASYLQGLLAKQGLDTLIRAFHFRSLFFDLGPIAKMELLVPASELKLAWEIIQPECIQIV